MLRIADSIERHCDGIHRRTFMHIGALGFGGLSLPQILAAESTNGTRQSTSIDSEKVHSHKAIIMVYLSGGPPQMDTFDMKPDAPREVRSEFDRIDTNVPGIQVCEHMPRTAQVMDKIAVVRSVTKMPHDHSPYHLHTGRAPGPQPAGGWPNMGAVISHLQGQVDRTVPASISLMRPMEHRPYGDPGYPGFLGSAHSPFSPTGRMMRDMTLEGITMRRLADRKALLSSFDAFRRKVDQNEDVGELDTYDQQALAILTSNKLVKALDVSDEDPETLAMYGDTTPKLSALSNDSRLGPGSTRDLLVARRLVEAGARCVTLTFGQWDTHSWNFRQCRNTIPAFDQALAALVQDLHNRGLDKDVSVVCWGEFGRTPLINPDKGRDHWPASMSVVMAGGGMRTGQFSGATDRVGGEVIERPIHYQQILATLYHQIGLDPAHATFTDRTGRPHFLVDHREPIAELI